jgi:4-amino-4-deoxy-L-arabinose transferase-like glycosyltransferase
MYSIVPPLVPMAYIEPMLKRLLLVIPNNINQRTGWLLLIVLSSVLLRFPFNDVPMVNDEGAYAFVASSWTGDYQLYRDIPFDRPQLLFLIFKGILSVFGSSIEAIRTGAAFFNVLTLLAVFAMTRRMFSTGAALASAALFAVASTAPAIEGFTANAELFAVLPLTLSFHASWREKWLTAAAWAAVATLIKPIGISGWLLAAAWLTWRRAGWKPLLMMSLVYATGPALSMFHGALVSWQGYWDSMVSDSLLSFQGVRQPLEAQFQSFIKGARNTLPMLALLLPLMLFALRSMSTKQRVFIGLTILATFAGMSIGGRWYWHYFIQLVPVLAVPAGVGLVACFRSRTGHAIGFVWLIAVAYFVVSQGPFWLLDGKQVSRELYNRPAYQSNEVVAEFLKWKTQPDQTIYVAFSQAELYYLADRRPAVPKQLFWNQVFYNRKVFDEVIRCLRAREPKYVVYERSSPHWMPKAQFSELLQQYYRPVQQFEGLVVLERIE